MKTRPFPIGWLVAGGLALVAHSAAAQGPPGLQLVDDLGCAACHAGLPATSETVRSRAPDLSDAGARFAPAFLYWYLREPTPIRNDIGSSRMPAFHLDERESLALALYLATLRGPSASSVTPQSASASQEREFESLRRDQETVTASTGERIARALNCAGCHAGLGPPAVIGPPLNGVGDRLQDGWLRGYLQRPVAVRPFGFLPGTGSRMPDFRLTAGEVGVLADYLGTFTSARPVRPFTPADLSAFSRDKALRFIRDRLPCLGCHALNGDGGRIGPDLALAAERLDPAYIRAMIADPTAVVPGTIMPQHPMPEDRVDLLASFLSEKGDASAAPVDTLYLSLVDHAPRDPTVDESNGAGLYARYCSMCHGATGGGDGYNAPYLPARPTIHADSAYLATRPDDTLFDGVHAGGYILNRSHRMPAFGQRLTYEQIRSLVRYIRELCRCEGPAWSRDNGNR